MRNWLGFGAAVMLAMAGCGSDSNPFQGGVDGGAVIDGAAAVDGAVATADAGTAEHWPTKCDAKPTRLVVLGDSITACSTLPGTKTSADCGATKFHAALEASLGTTITYQNLAVGGAVTADVPNRQLATVPTGMPGHVLVILTLGGNDLSPYIFQSDSAAQSGYDQMMPGILSNWNQIFAFFADKTKFPDGATVLMAKQYDPFDDCTASPYNLSPLKIGLLHMFNDSLAILANSNPDVYISDQFTSFLGHGHHYAVNTCPYYKPNSEYWMEDTIHPNVPGHANMAKVWGEAADHLYKTCTP